MRKLLLAVTICAFVGLGCGDDSATGGTGGSSGSGGSGGSGGIDAPMIDAPAVDGEVDGGVDGNPNDITGSFIDYQNEESGLTAFPVDLTVTTPGALIGTMSYLGSGMANGTFVIPLPR